jgi:hypothetical protein
MKADLEWMLPASRYSVSRPWLEPQPVATVVESDCEELRIPLCQVVDVKTVFELVRRLVKLPDPPQLSILCRSTCRDTRKACGNEH